MTSSTPQDYSPPVGEGEWERTTPAQAFWDADLLDEAVAFAGERNSTGMIVVHRGRILAEQYWADGDPAKGRDIASAQKSVVSVLVGAARQAGLLDIDAPSSDFLGEGWSRAPREHERRILLRHHLSMTTGLTEELVPEAEPGAAWAYNNRTYHIIKTGLERVTGRGLNEWSRDVLWDPIGMHQSAWVPRVAPPGVPRNVFAFGPEDAPYSALVTTLRDMARFGLLMANHGAWDGRTILGDRGYLDESVASSQVLNPAYGYLWWLNAPGPHLRPIREEVKRGPFIPAAPADLFCALGAGDQKIYVSRSLGLVIARQGRAAAEGAAALSSFDNDLWTKLMAAAPGGA